MPLAAIITCSSCGVMPSCVGLVVATFAQSALKGHAHLAAPSFELRTGLSSSHRHGFELSASLVL